MTPLLFCLAIGVGFAVAPMFAERILYDDASLEQVAIQGAKSLSPGAIAKILAIEPGRSLGTLDALGLRAAAKNEPWIDSIRSLRLPGGTLIVAVVERAAIARWQPSESEELALIDDHGKRFSADIEVGGPLPLVIGKIASGGILPDAASVILEEVRRHVVLTKDPTAITLHLPDQGLNSATGAAGNIENAKSGYVLQVGVNGPRALLGEVFLAQRIARLAALLESKESRLHGARLIDLRYADRAVLQTEPASG